MEKRKRATSQTENRYLAFFDQLLCLLVRSLTHEDIQLKPEEKLHKSLKIGSIRVLNSWLTTAGSAADSTAGSTTTSSALSGWLKIGLKLVNSKVKRILTVCAFRRQPQRAYHDEALD